MVENELIQARINAKSKSVVLAYILWWFLGIFGAHRFYSEKGHGVTMLIIALISIVTSFIIVGWFGILALVIWAIIDAFRLHKWITAYNLELAETEFASQKVVN
ncbi:MAG: TM2 domain-containing protein [Sphaerochaetaceae bacterium]|nr:TM2 domain-containing protein [Sphaerochaetaceae bacterium]